MQLGHWVHLYHKQCCLLIPAGFIRVLGNRSQKVSPGSSGFLQRRRRFGNPLRTVSDGLMLAVMCRAFPRAPDTEERLRARLLCELQLLLDNAHVPHALWWDPGPPAEFMGPACYLSRSHNKGAPTSFPAPSPYPVFLIYSSTYHAFCPSSEFGTFGNQASSERSLRR